MSSNRLSAMPWSHFSSAWLLGFLGRGLDRLMRRSAGLVYGLSDRPPAPVAFVLALQHLAIQAVYFVVPVAVAGFISPDPADVTRFLSELMPCESGGLHRTQIVTTSLATSTAAVGGAGCDEVNCR
jgi:hypothetical protein